MHKHRVYRVELPRSNGSGAECQTQLDLWSLRRVLLGVPAAAGGASCATDDCRLGRSFVEKQDVNPTLTVSLRDACAIVSRTAECLIIVPHREMTTRESLDLVAHVLQCVSVCTVYVQ